MKSASRGALSTSDFTIAFLDAIFTYLLLRTPMRARRRSASSARSLRGRARASRFIADIRDAERRGDDIAALPVAEFHHSPARAGDE